MKSETLEEKFYYFLFPSDMLIAVGQFGSSLIYD